MGRIQSDVGLITGIPIADTVKKLMEIAARPRDLLKARTETLEKEQVALTELTALLVAFQYTTDKLATESIYDQRKVTSSDETALAATITGQPAKASYQFTPLRMAQSQQLLSSGFASSAGAIGAGTFRFRFGDHVERAMSLAMLSGGEGFARGRIRITDRSGAAAEIDLTTAQNIDDVLAAINGNTTINVTAEAVGDAIRLTDNTGQTAANLKVMEFGGTTAASLGLAGIDVAASTATGQDIVRLGTNIQLSALNDGAGVSANRVLADFRVQLNDSTTVDIDLSPIVSGGSSVDAEVTLGDVIERINAAAPGKLQAEIDPGGDRLVIKDLSTPAGGTFSLTSLNGSQALADLGLDTAAGADQVTGRRLMGGLKTVLLSSLDGGQGLGTLGDLKITDRSGLSSTVHLASMETLQQVIDEINRQAGLDGLGITARISQARTGIELVDTTGAETSNLIVANADATNTADKLGITIDEAATSVRSDLHLQVISESTKLSSLNGGDGVALQSFTIVNSAGIRTTISLAGDDMETVGDVIRKINSMSSEIEADINETGDGIRLRKVSAGGGSFQIVEGGSTTASDLRLVGTSSLVEIDGEMVQVIDGTTTVSVSLDADDTLNDLVTKINDLGAGVTASTFYDGSELPYRLALVSNRAGSAGSLVFDTSDVAFSLQETARAQDALISMGPAGSASSVLVRSTSNTFSNVIDGLRLEIKQESDVPVTIAVTGTDTNLVATVETMVENYNKFRTKLKELTAYDAVNEKPAVLTGDSTALRLDTELSYLFSGRFMISGTPASMENLGIHLKDDGTLEFDQDAFSSQFAADPAGTKAFFTTETTGFSSKFHELLEELAGEQNSLLTSRLAALDEKITYNEERMASMSARLVKEQDRMLQEFYRLETAISKMQRDLSLLQSMQVLEPMTSSSSS